MIRYLAIILASVAMVSCACPKKECSSCDSKAKAACCGKDGKCCKTGAASCCGKDGKCCKEGHKH